MEELQLGLMKMKDLAAWFQISPGSFSNNKAKKLEELKHYCKFEDMGRKGINILEIYEAYYQTKPRQQIKKIFDEILLTDAEALEWGQDNNNIDTATHFANKIVQKYGDLGLKFNTIVSYVQQEKKIRYGKNNTRRITHKAGIDGSARYIFCKLMPDGSYEDFTEEKKQIKRYLYKQLGIGADVEEIEDFQAAKKAYERHEITEQEFIDCTNALLENKWYLYLGAIEEKLKCKCVFATHLTKKDQEHEEMD